VVLLTGAGVGVGVGVGVGLVLLTGAGVGCGLLKLNDGMEKFIVRLSCWKRLLAFA